MFHFSYFVPSALRAPFYVHYQRQRHDGDDEEIWYLPQYPSDITEEES
jgi:hypothetical protein